MRIFKENYLLYGNLKNIKKFVRDISCARKIQEFLKVLLVLFIFPLINLLIFF